MACRDDNNAHPNPPEPNPGPDIFASTSLENSKDKDALLKNIGYLCGTRVDNNDGPRRLTRQVAEFTGVNPPFVQEVNDLLTETIATTTERETNYVHQGWSISAASTICPWTSSRIAANNQPNAAGTWLTRRTLVKRLSVEVSLTDLAAVSEFKDEIEAALRRPTVFQQFEAVYRALHEWGDVVPLVIDMGVSLTFTDLEANMSQLPVIAKWSDTDYLTTIRTGRTTRQEGGGHTYWENELKAQRSIPPLDWCQIRITKVAATIKILPPELQNRLLWLYAKRLSYNPAVTIGPGCHSRRIYDDSPHASKQISSVTIYASDWVRSMRLTYMDQTHSTKHQGTEKYGSEYEFVLTEGEHITEMLIWRNDWICGLQFITSFGRCSPHFGSSDDISTVESIKGGVLVGVISRIRHDSDQGYIFCRIQGIWRHDTIYEAPKENDIFSEYFGPKNKGRPFNDRAVVRNSDMAISRIEVRCGSAIDSLQFAYADNTNPRNNNILTDRHGGLGGSKQSSVVLRSGEHVVRVSGKYNNNSIIQLKFVTNNDNTKYEFGAAQPDGESHSFSASPPEDNEGKRFRLQYICGKCDNYLKGIMFVWTPI